MEKKRLLALFCHCFRCDGFRRQTFRGSFGYDSQLCSRYVGSAGEDHAAFSAFPYTYALASYCSGAALRAFVRSFEPRDGFDVAFPHRGSIPGFQASG
jgi:hypothetical protein